MQYNKKTYLILIFTALFFSAHSIQASESGHTVMNKDINGAYSKQENNDNNIQENKLLKIPDTKKYSFGIFYGIQNINAKEFVYDDEPSYFVNEYEDPILNDLGNPKTSNLISLLHWKTKYQPIIKADFSWQPTEKITFNINGWKNINHQKSHMNDFDFLNSYYIYKMDWSMWSSHPNTNLIKNRGVDLSFSYHFTQKPKYQLSTLIGYQYNHLKWSASGINSYYDYRPTGGDLGSFDTLLGIDYSQKYQTPYIGISGNYFFNDKLELKGTFKYSKWGKTRAQDMHFSRNILFVEKNNTLPVFNSLELSLNYFFTPKLKLNTQYIHTQFRISKNDTTIFNHDEGTVYFNKKSGGMKNTNSKILIGLQYMF